LKNKVARRKSFGAAALHLFKDRLNLSLDVLDVDGEIFPSKLSLLYEVHFLQAFHSSVEEMSLKFDIYTRLDPFVDMSHVACPSCLGGGHTLAVWKAGAWSTCQALSFHGFLGIQLLLSFSAGRFSEFFFED
jgi:hypothetical protein